MRYAVRWDKNYGASFNIRHFLREHSVKAQNSSLSSESLKNSMINFKLSTLSVNERSWQVITTKDPSRVISYCFTFLPLGSNIPTRLSYRPPPATDPTPTGSPNKKHNHGIRLIYDNYSDHSFLDSIRWPFRTKEKWMKLFCTLIADK